MRPPDREAEMPGITLTESLFTEDSPDRRAEASSAGARKHTKAGGAKERARIRAAEDTRDLCDLGFNPITAAARQRALRRELRDLLSTSRPKRGNAANPRKVKPDMTARELKSYQKRREAQLKAAWERASGHGKDVEEIHLNIATRGRRSGEENLTPARRRLVSAQLLEDDSSSDERARGVGLDLTSASSSDPGDVWTGEPGRSSWDKRPAEAAGTSHGKGRSQKPLGNNVKGAVKRVPRGGGIILSSESSASDDSGGDPRVQRALHPAGTAAATAQATRRRSRNQIYRLLG